MPKLVYISGPMRQVHNFNWPAFDEAQKKLEEVGYIVFSPAESDRKQGIDPSNTNITSALIAECARRDLDAIFKADWIVTLPGWEDSIGARAEVAVARWLEKAVFPLNDILP